MDDGKDESGLPGRQRRHREYSEEPGSRSARWHLAASKGWPRQERGIVLILGKCRRGRARDGSHGVRRGGDLPLLPWGRPERDRRLV